MSGGTFLKVHADRQPVAGDEAAGGRQQHRQGDVIRFRCREQHAQRIALVQMGEAGHIAGFREADLGDARRREAAASARFSPMKFGGNYWESPAGFFAMMWKICQCFGSPSLVVPG